MSKITLSVCDLSVIFCNITLDYDFESVGRFSSSPAEPSGWVAVAGGRCARMGAGGSPLFLFRPFFGRFRPFSAVLAVFFASRVGLCVVVVSKVRGASLLVLVPPAASAGGRPYLLGARPLRLAYPNARPVSGRAGRGFCAALHRCAERGHGGRPPTPPHDAVIFNSRLRRSRQAPPAVMSRGIGHGRPQGLDTPRTAPYPRPLPLLGGKPPSEHTGHRPRPPTPKAPRGRTRSGRPRCAGSMITLVCPIGQRDSRVAARIEPTGGREAAGGRGWPL